MGYIGYIITGMILFFLGVVTTQLGLHLIKMKRESSQDE